MPIQINNTEYNNASKGYNLDGLPSTKEVYLPTNLIIKIYKKLNPEIDKTAIPFLKIDFILYSSSLPLRKAWTKNNAHKLIKNDKYKGNALNKSLIATSGEPLTMDPKISAKEYSMLKKVNEEKTNRTIITKEVIKD